MNKDEILNIFIKKHEALPKQGSTEWLNNRKYRIGGSEISTVLKKNPYQKIKDLIQSHTGLKVFKGFFATHWGVLFEPIIRDHINILLNCNIIETGSIPHNTNKYISYSPDGISLVDTKKIKDILEENNKINYLEHEDEKSIILFEFKCPYKRIPSGKIPDYYIDQPRLGMEVIDICDMGIFIEAVYKITSFNNLIYNNKYNNIYHKDKQIITTNPINYGIIILYYANNTNNNIDDDINKLIDNDINTDDEIDKLIREIDKLKYDIKIGNINDLGLINNTYIINQILKYSCCNENKKLSIIDTIQYSYNINNFEKTNEQIINFNNNIIQSKLKTNLNKEINKLIENDNTIFGILPYKLFTLDINPVKKVDNFLHTDLQIEINNIMNVIKQCENISSTQQLEIIKTHYPK